MTQQEKAEAIVREIRADVTGEKGVRAVLLFAHQSYASGWDKGREEGVRAGLARAEQIVIMANVSEADPLTELRRAGERASEVPDAE